MGDGHGKKKKEVVVLFIVCAFLSFYPRGLDKAGWVSTVSGFATTLIAVMKVHFPAGFPLSSTAEAGYLAPLNGELIETWKTEVITWVCLTLCQVYCSSYLVNFLAHISLSSPVLTSHL